MVTNNASNFGTGTSGQVLTSNGAGVAPTFQAAAAGSGQPTMPVWVNANPTLLYWNTAPYTTNESLTPLSKRTYLVPFSTQGTFDLNKIAVLCDYQSPFTDTVRFGIYTMASDGAVTLSADFGTASANAAGAIGKSALHHSVSPGFYYLAVIFNTVNSNYYCNKDNVAVVVDVSTGNLIAGFVYNNGASTLPASISAANLSGTQIVSPPLILISTP